MTVKNSNSNNINAKFYDLAYSGEKGREVTESECVLISSLVGAPPKTILDIGAGTGRHSIPLTKMGYTLTAIDASKGMLDILIKSSDDLVETIYGDIFVHKFSKLQKFNMCILMWNVVNEIALTKLALTRLLKKIKSVLEKDGIALINIENVDRFKSYIPEFSFTKEAKDIGKIKVEWTNFIFNARTNTTVSKEVITINGNKQPPALIKQRWWKSKDIKFIAKSVGLKTKVYNIKENNEHYILLSKIKKSV